MAPAGDASCDAARDIADLAVEGPFGDGRLAVYLLEGSGRAARDWLTLEDGLTTGLVTVTEADEPRIDVVRLENRSDRPLLLHEGDRLVGGLQDRAVRSTLVVGPGGGPARVPVVCIEQERWYSSEGSREFRPGRHATLVSSSLRHASALTGDQSTVWRSVAAARRLARRTSGLSSRDFPTSSLSDVLDHDALGRPIELLERPLRSLPSRHPAARGAAFAVDGRLAELDLYPDHVAFDRVYPKLLRAHALDAVLRPGRASSIRTTSGPVEGPGRHPPASAVVAAWLEDESVERLRHEHVAEGQAQTIHRRHDGHRVTTTWDGSTLHTRLVASRAG